MKTIVLSLLVAAAGFADLAADWKSAQPFDVAQPGLIELSLPADTLNAARPGLEDLRVIDPSGREVPFTIERPVAGKVTTHRARSIHMRLDEEQGTQILIETGVTEPLDGVTLETPATAFIKAVTVAGSPDGRKWQELAAGQPIFRQGSATQLHVSFSPGIWPWLRVTVNDHRAEAIAFTGALVSATTGESAPAESLAVTITDRTENDGQTRLVVDLGAGQQTLASLSFGVEDPLFTRSVDLGVREVTGDVVTERRFAHGTIFRVDVPGAKRVESLDIPLDCRVPDRELLILVQNADNPPLQIKTVRVQRRPVYVVFLAKQAGRYQALTGNPRCAAPRYDLAALASQLKGGARSTPKLSPISANPAYRPTEALPEIEDLGTALDVTNWTYRKSVRMTRPGVQRLELDLDVLSRRSDVAFHDVRLLRDGKQRPYIVEGTSIQRRIVPEVTPVNDPKRPTVSRWRLKLSHHHLPVTSLTCTTVTPLFQRTVRLYEEPADERGEHYQRDLVQATWVRTPPATKAPLTLTFTTPPVTDTLYLETDNGDNPPVELGNFTLVYPVTRLLFKAPLEPPTFLYYGNPDVRSPSYDLNLIAPRLLAEETSSATLAGEEALKKSAVGELFQLSSTKSVIFWIALALVVVVLLVVITRLLPKDSQGNGQP